MPALEALGFTVQHLTSPTMSLLLAKWSHRAPGGLTYTLSYTHHRPEGGPPLPVAADSARASALDTAALGRLAALPAYLVPAPAASTSRQRRQWQRAQVRNLARAGVQPGKIKNSSVASAPGATAVKRPGGHGPACGGHRRPQGRSAARGRRHRPWSEGRGHR